MDTTVRELLLAGGIDVDDMLERCMGNEVLLKRLLNKFLSDSSYHSLEEAMQQGNEGAAMEASHTLKGITGNLSMKALFELVDIQVKALRNHDMKTAATMMPDITSAYNSAMLAIQKAFN